MIRVALKGLARRKLRAALTAIAIVLGVAMISGTYVLTDTIKAAFGGIFTAVYAKHRRDGHRQVGVRPERQQHDDGAAVRRVAARRRSARCRTSRPRSAASAAIAHIIVDGKVVPFGGAPNLGFSVDPHGARASTAHARRRARGRGPNEVVIDAGAPRRQKDLQVGQTIGVQANGPSSQLQDLRPRPFGGAASARRRDALGLRPPDRAAALHSAGKLDQIRAQAKPGSPAQLVERDPAASCRRHAGEDRQRSRRSRTRRTRRASSTSSSDFLLAFGAIALFVGAFVIANSLSITITQRTRELATLRTLGASRRQVRFSIVVEALRDRRPRLGRRALPSASGSASASSSCSTPSASRCRTTDWSSQRARWSSRSSSGSS